MRFKKFVLYVGQQRVTLRPTLRAACNLDEAYDGFQNLAKKVLEGSLTAIADIICEGSLPLHIDRKAIEQGLSKPLASLEKLQPGILRFILALAGADEAEATDKEGSGSTSEPIPFSVHHTKLFQIATGWLGWTPKDAWDATTPEILEAYKGYCEKLSAIYGGNTDTPDSSPNNARDEADWQSFKASMLANGIARLGAGEVA